MKQYAECLGIGVPTSVKPSTSTLLQGILGIDRVKEKME